MDFLKKKESEGSSKSSQLSASAIAFIMLGIMSSNAVKAEMIDVDGNTYETVIIGKQEWAVENLRVKTFNNGDTIAIAITKQEWLDISAKDKVPAYTPAPEDAEYGELFGFYYNGHAINDDRGLCPQGWRLPHSDDVSELAKSVDHVSELFATSVWKGKPAKYDHYPPDNKSGFTALPTGFRGGDAVYYGVHLSEDNTNIIKSERGSFWTSDDKQAYLIYSDVFGSNLRAPQSQGMPVRCMRD